MIKEIELKVACFSNRWHAIKDNVCVHVYIVFVYPIDMDESHGVASWNGNGSH